VGLSGWKLVPGQLGWMILSSYQVEAKKVAPAKRIAEARYPLSHWIWVRAGQRILICRRWWAHAGAFSQKNFRSLTLQGIIDNCCGAVIGRIKNVKQPSIFGARAQPDRMGGQEFTANQNVCQTRRPQSTSTGYRYRVLCLGLVPPKYTSQVECFVQILQLPGKSSMWVQMGPAHRP